MKYVNLIICTLLVAVFSACNKTEPENTNNDVNNEENQVEDQVEDNTILSVDVQLAEGLEAPSFLTLYLFDSDGTAQREDYSDYGTTTSYSFTLSEGAYTVVAVANMDSELPTEDEVTTLGLTGLVDSLLAISRIYDDMLAGLAEATVVTGETTNVDLTLQRGVIGLPGVEDIGILSVNVQMTEGLAAPSPLTFYLFDSDGTAQRKDYDNYSTTGLHFFTLDSGGYTIIAIGNVDDPNGNYLLSEADVTELGMTTFLTSLLYLNFSYPSTITGYTVATVVAGKEVNAELTLYSGLNGIINLIL